MSTPGTTDATSPAPTGRTTVKRLAERASYERAEADAILDEGLVCHVGLATDDGPVVIPMLYARDGDRLLLHGSAASRLLRSAGKGLDVCVTVTHLDGLVLARSAFHHSVNYRSVVVMGRAEPITDLAARREALDILVDSVVPGRMADTREPNERELRATIVLSLPLEEFSVKSRSGGPKEEPEDMALPVWAGVVPVTQGYGAPIADPDLAPSIPVPAYASGYHRG
jgi:nitroimidazol reductase NimA-like FMN-containing flavoprotein (pyridoxamine 5'-phosphate oxidase superfamily)